VENARISRVIIGARHRRRTVIKNGLSSNVKRLVANVVEIARISRVIIGASNRRRTVTKNGLSSNVKRLVANVMVVVKQQLKLLHAKIGGLQKRFVKINTPLPPATPD